jgi:serine/threonine-protein kinase
VTPERWREVKLVVQGALDRGPAERPAFLDAACAADGALRREVDSLLAAADDEASLPGPRAAIAAEAAELAADRAAVPNSANTTRPVHAADRGDGLRAVLDEALGCQYEILRPLGRGAMGAVYLARERALERLVAIKVLRPEISDAPEIRERFRREARIAARLSHPSILPLYTFGEVGGLWYFVMGYVRGDSLAERLRLEGRLTPAEARRVLAELADALDCAHRNGIVHRDVKPANVLIDDESGRAILADFGISKVEGAGETLTLTGAVFGTPHYMSPEQAVDSRDVDGRSDLYSLGVVGYVMLAGQEPCAGAREPDSAGHRTGQATAPLSLAARGVPDELAAAIVRCLATDPAERWPDARTLKDALASPAADPVLRLPAELRDLPSFGPYAVLWVLGWTVLAATAIRSPTDRALLLLVALLVPVGLALQLLAADGHGLRRADVVRIAFWPPQWWGMWWPVALRRPDDLWRRIPWPARFARIAVSVFFVSLPLLILVRHELAAGPGAVASGAWREWLVAAEAVVVVATAAAAGGGFWWAARRGLAPPDAARVLFGATTPSPAWHAPHLARLLAPASGRVRPPEPGVPHDYRRAIGELAPLLPPGARALGAEATAVARRLVLALDRLDCEIASLVRDAGEGELERIEVRLRALQESAPNGGEERQELRVLLEHQLALVRRMHGRQELAVQRRAHLLDLLRALWTQLAAVAEAADGGGATEELTRRLRALCAEIAEQGDPPPAPLPVTTKGAPAGTPSAAIPDASRPRADAGPLGPR